MPSSLTDFSTVGVLAFGVAVWLGLSVSPLRGGPVESAVLAGLLVAGLFQFVLDDAFAR